MDTVWITDALGRQPVGWRDAVDIALVSLLIYEVLTLIRGTRAVQMAVGAGLTVALFYVSQVAGLETVNWLIRNMIGYVVFAAIVIFQSDIRRALAHLGRAPFFRYLATGETVDETVEEMAVAAQMLSAQRTGAIICIERQIGLRNYVEGGIPIDAQISYDLLVTIFQAGLAAARRRGDHPGESCLGGGLLPSADDQSEAEQGSGHTPSRGDRPDRGERRARDCRLRGDGMDLARPRRPSRAQSHA